MLAASLCTCKTVSGANPKTEKAKGPIAKTNTHDSKVGIAFPHFHAHISQNFFPLFQLKKKGNTLLIMFPDCVLISIPEYFIFIVGLYGQFLQLCTYSVEYFFN